MAKPASKLNWTYTNASPGTVRTEPTAGKKVDGWFSSERPAFQFLNWIFFNISEWIDYFEGELDAGIAGFGEYVQWKVGDNANADYASLYELIQAGVVQPGDRIFVYSSEVMNDTVQLSVNGVEVEFHPRVTMTKGTATLGIEVIADRVRIKGGRFVDFSTGGDIAIQFNAGADLGRVSEVNFTNCDTTINDLGNLNALFGNIEE